MEYLHIAVSWIGLILKMTVTYILILLGPGLIFAFILHYLHKFVESNAYALLGRNVYLGFFGGFGTMIHEIGHAIMCIIFGHQIVEMELFNLDPENGALGYVRHSYNQDSIWANIGNFFIGIGPIILGSLVVYFAASFLVSKSFFTPLENLHISIANFSSLDAVTALFINSKKTFLLLADKMFTLENLWNWKFWLFIYILFVVGSSMNLSWADIEGASYGFGAIFTLFIFISIITLVFAGRLNTNWLISITRKYSFIYAIMLLSIFLNAVLLGPLALLRKLLGK